MAITYEKVIEVISQSPDMRKDFEVNNLIPWFAKKSDLFRNLKTELLFDIIKNLQFETKQRDELIIKQGERGDCMYILLRGQITIYILYASKGDTDDDKPNQPVITAKGGDTLRTQLGTFVTHLGPGATFGEVALLKEDDCIRTASIIAHETTDLIVVDRDLYDRSVKNVLKQEFEDKQNFINENPLFQYWPPKYRKQLAMALQKDILPYEGQLTRQGDPLIAIYYILRGEIKVVMDPALHRTQYSKLPLSEDQLTKHEQNGHPDNEEEDEKMEELLKMSSQRDKCHPEHGLSSKFRRKAYKKQLLEICLLTVNESIGDIEILLDLDSYMQTATCTQRTEILVLEMKHYERLLVKRNPRSVDSMKEGLEIRIKSRISKHLEKSVPILKCLYFMAEEYNLQKQQQTEARLNAHAEKQKKSMTIQESFDSFIPPRGPLIDIYGQGTVFHRIRERERAKLLKTQRGRNKMFGNAGGFNAFGGGGAKGDMMGAREPTVSFGTQNRSNGHGGNVGDMQDPGLSNLEKRMKNWLSSDMTPKGQPRIAKLHRATTEPDQLKPGATIVIHRRQVASAVHRQMAPGAALARAAAPRSTSATTDHSRTWGRNRLP